MLVAWNGDLFPAYQEHLLKAISRSAKENEYAPNIELFKDSASLLFRIEEASEQEQGEIVFLDAELPGLGGMGTAEKIRKLQTENEIIFLARNLDHVLEAFDVDALHYIIYNETPWQKVAEICAKAIRRSASRERKWLPLNCAGMRVVVPVDSIRYFEVYDHILRVYYDETYFDFYSTLGKMEGILGYRDFLRVHKSFYVAIRYIRSIVSKEVTMVNGTKIPIGKTYYSDVKSRWIELMNSSP